MIYFLGPSETNEGLGQPSPYRSSRDDLICRSISIPHTGHPTLAHWFFSLSARQVERLVCLRVCEAYPSRSCCVLAPFLHTSSPIVPGVLESFVYICNTFGLTSSSSRWDIGASMFVDL